LVFSRSASNHSYADIDVSANEGRRGVSQSRSSTKPSNGSAPVKSDLGITGADTKFGMALAVRIFLGTKVYIDFVLSEKAGSDYGPAALLM
jgi:hypothetical protein